MIRPEQLDAAMERLDAPSRALLELSARRGMRDEEIADFLGIEPADAAHRREQALRQLENDLGLAPSDRDDLREQLVGVDRPEHQAIAPDARAAVGPREKRWAAIGMLAILAAIVVGTALALGGGDEEGRPGRPEASTSTSRAQRTRTAPAPRKRSVPTPRRRPAPRPTPVRALERLRGTHGEGTAQVVRRGSKARLRIRASGFLRPKGGGYAVWLLNAPSDARRLYATRATKIARDLALPSGFTRFRLVEVARAVPALASKHSGISLLRIRVRALEPGGR